VRKRGEYGVTLIELVVVIAIIAVIGLCMAPAIGEWLDNFRIRQAARDIVSNLQYAKIKAISSCIEHRICFDLANETYHLEKNDGAWTQEGNKFHVPSGVDIASVTYNPPRVKFDPDGTSSSGHIKLENEQGKTCKVVIYYTGRIRIEK
jgi:prepilin-type N-terminal cleavage/methylation domain-containing protein